MERADSQRTVRSPRWRGGALESAGRTRAAAARLVVGVILGSLGVGAPLRAADPPKTMQALPIEEPIKLDGYFDEPAWTRAVPASGFVQREPATGAPASEDTDVRVLYTPKMLYIGIDARDRQPELVISKEMQRDEPLWRDDAVDILLDTFGDDRNAYLFETNPNGARTDALITDEGRSFNLQWDGVWDVAARRTATGWCAEVAIPFSTIRFDPSVRAWGFNVLRYVRRRAEQAFWAPILLDADVKRVSLYGDLVGIGRAEPGLNLNVKPFSMASTRARASAPGGDATKLEAGLDVKWGMTRSTSLDLTVNTDFAETEVDALQVNLTRFPLFFPEKRYFFLENAGIFDFGTREAGAGDAPLMKLFFSRRIGLAGNGEEVPIDWGVRTTGRAGPWSFGLLDVQNAAGALGGASLPRDNWATARLTRNFGQRSSFGAILTQRYNSGNTNRAYGFDVSYKPTARLGFTGYAAGSDNSSPEGVSDWSAGGATSFTGAVWNAQLGFDHVGEDFDPEAGFLLRRGVDRYLGRVAWEPRPELPRIMNLHFELDSRVYTDLRGRVESERHRLDLVGLRTTRASEAYLYVASNFERLETPFAIAPGVVIAPGEYRFDDVGIRYLTHSSRPVSVEGIAAAGQFYDGSHLSSSFTLRLRPNRHLRSESVWQVDDVRLPAGDFRVNVVRQRLAFALSPRLLTNVYLQYSDLDDLVSLNLRFNWTYRPGSDVYVVFNQRWGGATSALPDDWQLQAKLTYLFQR
jgi:Domain of unknown function (DUF5916)/Carbohydrate family 9 binding domain-like